MSETRAREQVIHLATSDSDAALSAARRINDPWFRSQALAWVARFAPDDRVEAVASESFSVGQKARDEYQVVASAAWPLRALVEREKTNRMDSIIGRYLNRSTSIENLASRCEALFLVFQSVFPAGQQHWLIVLQALNGSATPALHWRQERNLRDAILMAAREDSGFAAEFCRGVTNPKARRQAETRLAKSESLAPREFFWRSNEQS